MRTANRSFYRTFQALPADTEGQIVYELGNGQWNIPRLRALLEQILVSHTEFADFEVEHDSEAIGRRTMLLNARRVEGEEDRLILLAIEDITGRVRMEKDHAAEAAGALERERLAREGAESANRAKDVFLATLSHELRTPLTAMLAWIRMIRAGKLNPATTAQGLEAIERNTRAQAQLIEDLLDVSRITSGKLRLKRRPLELVSLIETSIEALRPAAEAKGIRVEASLLPSEELVLGDRERLQQIVWNLLSNAIKFTPENGQVVVSLNWVDRHARLIVRDSGKGISPEFLPRIFERFRQEDDAMTRTHGGLGLGLAIVRHLVELHGGTVTADSQGAGHGATFTVELPLPRVPSVRARQDQVSRPPITADMSVESTDILAGIQVLVVDDQPDAREVLKAVLQM
ncbi:MAG: sensor histidine kinase, partial [Acidimicrobiia bacterium]